jgi:gliding motility-associated-like protein
MRTLFTLFACLLTQLAGAQPDRQPVGPATQPTLEFIENKGQCAAPVRYTAALPGGGQLFAERDGLRLALLEPGALARASGHSADSAAHLPKADYAMRGHALDLRFVNASPATHLMPASRTAEHRNYFRGRDPARWAADVRSYRELRYAELWPGVDARFYENADERLEYDFTVAPGASPAAIGLRHAGAPVTLDALGNLQLATSVGVVRELAPQAWQLGPGGAHQPVACRYRLDQDNTVHFEVGAYDPTRPLTIDPTLVFATYTGSTYTNWGCTATYDAQGNLYSGGIVFGQGYPVSPGAFQTSFRGNIDMGLIKYDVTKSGPAARVWATYVGGNQAEYPHSMVVNSQGELLVLGSTGSSDFPVTASAVQRTYRGGSIGDSYLPSGADIVVCRLSANGTAMRASTYLGGTGNDGLLPLQQYSSITQLPHNFGDSFRGDILVDNADNVYIASCTASADFLPAGTPVSFQRSYRGGTVDGVVCKLTPNLSALLWGGYLGGNDADGAYSLQIEPSSGDVYVAGGTLSPDLPATAGALSSSLAGNVDGYVARIAANGNSIVRTTYLGTSAYDQAYFVQLGTDGGVYVLGQSLGAYPVTPGLYTTPNGHQFIHKLDADLRTTQLATVFGSGRNTIDISPTAFLVDNCDRVFVCGWGGGANQLYGSIGTNYLSANNGSYTTGLPVTAYAVQSTTDGSDFYLAQFGAGLKNLGYGTFFGGYANTLAWGEHVDGGTSRFDPRGVVYQAVCTCGASASFPIPPGANYYSATSGTSNNCNNAAFVLNFRPDVADVGPPQTVCVNLTTPLEGSPSGGVWTGPGVSGSVDTGFTFTPPGVGTYALTYTVATGLCSSSAVRQVTTLSPADITITTALPSSYCLADGAAAPTTLLVGSPAGGTFSGPGVTTTATGAIFNPNLVSGVVEITYTYAVGCNVQVKRRVEVVRATAGAGQTLCNTAGAISLQGSPAGGTWAGPGVSGSVATGFRFTPSAAALGTVDLTYTLAAQDNSCAVTSIRRYVVLSSAPPVLAPLPSPLCASTTTRYPLVANPSGGSWSGPGVGVSGSDYYFTPSQAGAGTFTLSYSIGAGTACNAQRTLAVTVSAALVATVPADTLLCPGTTSAFRLRGASPADGTWAGSGVSGSAATGFFFTPPAGFAGPVVLTYTVSSGGCTAVTSRSVAIAPVPVLQPAWAPVACPEDRQSPLVVRFTNAGGSPAHWDFGDGTPPVEGADVRHTYQEAGRYQPSVSLRYLNAQCETTAPLAAVEVLNQPIPNVITPNGDKDNQYFRLPPSCEPRLQLFSRWGQLVHEAAVYHNDWDATGHPAGIYYYLLTYPDGHRVKGWLEVMK